MKIIFYTTQTTGNKTQMSFDFSPFFGADVKVVSLRQLVQFDFQQASITFLIKGNHIVVPFTPFGGHL